MDAFLLFAFVVAVAAVIDFKAARNGQPVWVAIAFGAVSAGLTMFDAHGSALAAMLLGGGFVAQFSEARVCAECSGPLERNEYGDAVCRNPQCFLGQPKREVGAIARHRDGAER
jgi:hypothetical protein